MLETLSYLLLCLGAFSTVFMFGWQFGCWMNERADRIPSDCLHDKQPMDFHNAYYTDNKVKYTSTTKPKKKAKKTSKK